MNNFIFCLYVALKAPVVPTSFAHSTRAAWTSTSSRTPKPVEYLDITDASEEERNTSDVVDDEVTGKDLKVEVSRHKCGI